MAFLQSLRLDGLLSFAPGSEAIPLTGLNVLIGPNGAGKSNLIEAIDLLHAAPMGLANAITLGGRAVEWIWKGKTGGSTATIDTVVTAPRRRVPDIRYKLAFRSVGQGYQIVSELIEETKPRSSTPGKVVSHYRLDGGKYSIGKRKKKGDAAGDTQSKSTSQGNGSPAFRLDESILLQRKEPDIYPELTWLGEQFSRIHTFREWSIGRYAEVRKPQSASLPGDTLLADSRNLGMVLNELEHRGHGPEFNRCLKRFFPRFERVSTRVIGGTVQFYLHESDFGSPIPATRLSDGTIRFLALLVILLSPSPPPVVCIEEPELGLHPDALFLIADLLVAASERMQLVVTTHSDALVSALTEHADSVLVCERIGGATVVRRVDAEKMQHWLDRYRLGDIWRIGELGGNP